MAIAQASTAKPAITKPATAKTAATTAPAAATEDGNPVPVSPFSQGPPTKPGLELKAIHMEDRKWREAQRGYVDPRRINRIQPKELRAVDPATQEKEYEH